MAKLLTDETALQLTEALLQNDKNIKNELEGKIPSIEGLASESFVQEKIANAQLSGGDVDLSSYATKDFVTDKISEIDGGSSELTTDIKANVAVGGIKANDVLAAGMTLDEIVTKLCVTYIKPSVSLSISPSTTLYKKGETVSNLRLEANVTKNSESIKSVKFYNGATPLETVITNVENGGKFTHTMVDDISADTTVKAEVADGISIVSATKTIKFVNPYYYGVSTVANVVGFIGLTELLQEKTNTTKAFTANNEYIVFACDSAYADLTDIVDQNGFSNLSDFTKSTLVVNGVTYKVYVSNTPKTISNFKYTFK